MVCIPMIFNCLTILTDDEVKHFVAIIFDEYFQSMSEKLVRK